MALMENPRLVRAGCSEHCSASRYEEAPGAYKDSTAVVEAAHLAGLSRKVATLEPLICIKG